MKKTIIAIVALAFISPSISFAANEGSSFNANARTDQIIIKYSANSRSASKLDSRDLQLIKNRALTNGHVMNFFRTSAGGHVFKLDKFHLILDIKKTTSSIIAASSDIEYAEADGISQPMQVPNDPYYYYQWALNTAYGVNAEGAWPISKGNGAVVAVIDTGYLPHEDLNANTVNGYDFISDWRINHDYDGRDSSALDPGDWRPANLCFAPLNGVANSSWHGTAVAGIIAATSNNGIGVAGVAPNAKVLAVRVLGTCGGYNSDIADAIIWSSGGTVSGVAANPTPAQVLNLSLGGQESCPSAMQSAINSARSRNALVVVAAGNDSTNVAYAQPANCAGVMAVAANDMSGVKTGFSNYGAGISLSAPGYNIIHPFNSGTTSPGADTYRYWEGTSFAAPHVSAVAALVVSVNPYLSNDQIAKILTTTAAPFSGACSGCGSGIVDARGAVNAAVSSRTQLSYLPAAIAISGSGGTNYSAILQVKNTGTVPMSPTALSITQTSGWAENLAVYSDQCTGHTLTPGTSCQVVVMMMAGCGASPTSSTWNLMVSATGASNVLAVPISGYSSAGTCS